MGIETPPNSTDLKAESTKVEVRLFGPPRFVVGGEVQSLPDKAFVLLAILAASANKAASRSQIRSILWGDFDREKANANLRQLIARILKFGQKFDLTLLDIRGDMVSVNENAVTIDYGAFMALQRGGIDKLPSAQRCETLLALWTGRLLDGFGFDEAAVDEWMEANREEMRDRFVDAAREALDAAVDPESADAAWRLALKVLDVDRTEEAAYRAMMRICAAKGDRGFALRIFGRCKRTMATELGVLPSAQTMELAAALRHRDADALEEAVLPAVPREREAPVAAKKSDRQIPVVLILPPISVVSDEMTRTMSLGFVEDLTIGLSRFRRFAVIAAHSGASVAFGTRGLSDALAVLDVDYAVATSLMPATHGHRFGVRLTNVSNSEVLWATETDFTFATLGGTFERVTGLILRSMVNAIDDAEVRTPIPVGEYTAYRNLLEGRRLLHGSDLQSIRRARRMFKEALTQVPNYPAAVVGLARTMTYEWVVRGMVENDLLKESVDLASKAASIDPHDGRALRERGYANLYLRRHDESLQDFSQAVALNPHDADILEGYADSLAHSGDPKQGLNLFNRAIELNPIPPDEYAWTLGSIYYQLGDYRAALQALRPVEDSPATARLLAACTAQLGELELARHYSKVVKSVYPDFQADRVRAIVPNRNSEDTEHLIDGLKRAGLG
ncbi:BTAD domain-containing putative transcriptional regulator [Dongia sp.]|uniref:BTAD domain-containing putative transcriptional regulator n=1 Tax=Dongia sp. TaxID=1977262 RepID=UPI00375136D1